MRHSVFSICLILGFALFQAVPVSAEVVRDRSAWNALTAKEQEGYVKGIWDANSVIYETTDKFVNKMAVKTCAEDRKFTARIIADAVSDVYAEKPDRVNDPAAIIVIGLLFNTCIDYINEAREKAGLEPEQMWQGW